MVLLLGGRSELDPSGVLFLFAAMCAADMMNSLMGDSWGGLRGRKWNSVEAWLAAEGWGESGS